MDVTGKYEKLIEASKKKDTIYQTKSQQQQPIIDEQENRAVILSKIQGLLGWAYEKSDPSINFTNQ